MNFMNLGGDRTAGQLLTLTMHETLKVIKPPAES